MYRARHGFRLVIINLIIIISGQRDIVHIKRYDTPC